MCFDPLLLHENNCKICAHLDYEHYNSFAWIKKNKCRVNSPFPLNNVPNHLLDSILTKVHYTVFTRFRRVNKFHHDYVESKREHLKPAFFHDKTIHLLIRGGENDDELIPRIRFNSYHFWNDYEEWGRRGAWDLHFEFEATVTEKKESWFARWMGNQSSDVKIKRIPIYVTLTDFEQNEDIRRELTGIYKPVSLEVTEHDCVQYDWINQFDRFKSRFFNFLQWTRITELKGTLTLTTFDVDPSIVVQIADELLPKKFKFDARNAPSDFLASNCFKNTKFVIFSVRGLNPTTFNQFEIIQSGFKGYGKEELKGILEAWIEGDSKTAEMWIDASAANIAMAELHAEEISILKAWKHVKDYLPLRSVRHSRFYILKQHFTGKKALCTVVEFHYRPRFCAHQFFFKTIS